MKIKELRNIRRLQKIIRKAKKDLARNGELTRLLGKPVYSENIRLAELKLDSLRAA